MLFKFIKDIGWREAANAVLGATVVGLVVRLVILGAIAIVGALGLTGCAGMSGFLEYEHHSSAPDYYDRNTSDMVGFCLAQKLAPELGLYSPVIEGCFHDEITDKPVFGSDPVGTLRLRQPIFTK